MRHDAKHPSGCAQQGGEARQYDPKQPAEVCTLLGRELVDPTIQPFLQRAELCSLQVYCALDPLHSRGCRSGDLFQYGDATFHVVRTVVGTGRFNGKIRHGATPLGMVAAWRESVKDLSSQRHALCAWSATAIESRAPR